ncbi:PaaI family thioesterase [Kyrpidia sp.]|uniref:PaaI family thioesterase n=1 Tax=Kyrpidia sp. TaxID=2073077 RepID=UPI00258AB835|nr:PaaI family thioesterase [Kyrpidia sp.]MCL6577043.1 PaaI family thioesterase [Kyrpidia sp.]
MGYERCYVCGAENPKGLHLHFEKYGEEGVTAEFNSEEWHDGWPGIQHGGITCALLDEAAAYVANNLGLITVTAKLDVEFQNPIHSGETVRVVAFPVRKTRRLIEAEAQITSLDGVPKARAHAKMMVLNHTQLQSMGLEGLTPVNLDPDR